MSKYTPIPITRATTASRAHSDITYGFTKAGALSIILSPSFLEAQPSLSVGDKVLIGYNPETHGLLIAPPKEDETMGLRTVRPRTGFAGAGVILVSGQNLPEALPVVSKRIPVAWAAEENNAVVLDLSALA